MQNEVVGNESEGRMTSSYKVDDGVVLKVPYSFLESDSHIMIRVKKRNDI